LDKNKKYEAVFNFDAKENRWYIAFEELKEGI